MIIRKMRIADMHCDTLDYLESEKGRKGDQDLWQNEGQLDLRRMRESGYFLQNFAIYVDLEAYPDGWARAMVLADRFEREMQKHAQAIGQVRSFAEMEQNRKEGRLSAMLTVEEGGICQGRTERLERLYALGVRMMTLTWNYPNELGNPASPHNGKKAGVDARARQMVREGLSALGIQFVQEMEELGMIVDVSHLSDAGAWDVLRHVKKPIVASHSNARAVCEHPRNLPDSLIRAIGERGGCIGLNYYLPFVGGTEEGILESLARHARQIVKVGGMECLGLGSDFDGIAPGKLLRGAESVPMLWECLRRNGFTEGQAEMVFEKNVLRVYREILG